MGISVIYFVFFTYVSFMQVSNAQEELLQWHAANAKNNPKLTHATERCAAGIIQAIGHFKLGPSTSPRDIKDESDGEVKSIDLGHEVVKLYLFYERWRRAEIDNSEIYLSSLKANCVSQYSLFYSCSWFWHLRLARMVSASSSLNEKNLHFLHVLICVISRLFPNFTIFCV